jgi:hypothetical protein
MEQIIDDFRGGRDGERIADAVLHDGVSDQRKL